VNRHYTRLDDFNIIRVTVDRLDVLAVMHVPVGTYAMMFLCASPFLSAFTARKRPHGPSLGFTASAQNPPLASTTSGLAKPAALSTSPKPSFGQNGA
jgi:hypothetical protein